jgi:nicotinate-nucleotide pyrophosphorylase (carboxylating)
MDWKSTRINALLELALEEDRAGQDATTRLTIDPNLRATATVIARQDMVVCGLGAIPRFLALYARMDRRGLAQTRFDVVSHPEIFDGVKVREGQTLAVIRHNAQVLLSTERVILNLMQHLSGIATSARRYVDAIEGTGAHLLDTRKTIPGLRTLEKYAVVCGGGVNHRLDLASGILIKNNHIALGGGVARALTNALNGRNSGQKNAVSKASELESALKKGETLALNQALHRTQKGHRVQVEVRTPEELEAALAHGAESLLLDNMTPTQVKQSVERVRQFCGAEKWIPLEASGGIVLENIRAYAEAGVDFISVGALTHSAKAADISMRIQVED